MKCPVCCSELASALEAENDSLRAQVERMKPVLDAADIYVSLAQGDSLDRVVCAYEDLAKAVQEYQAAPKGAAKRP